MTTRNEVAVMFYQEMDSCNPFTPEQTRDLMRALAINEYFEFPAYNKFKFQQFVNWYNASTIPSGQVNFRINDNKLSYFFTK
jgi:hypothetical protein